MTISTSVERRRLRARLALTLSTILCSSAASPVFAQVVTNQIPPQRQNLDENAVDRASGQVFYPHPALTIGPPGRGGLSVTGFGAQSGNNADDGGNAGGAATNWGLVIYFSGSTYNVVLGQTSDAFTKSGSTFTSNSGNGATLTQSGTTYTYVSGDGTKIVYDNTWVSYIETNVAARAGKIYYPTGETATLTWARLRYCSNIQDACSGGKYLYAVRLQSVVNSLGYMAHYNYNFNYVSGSADYLDAQRWVKLNGISMINLSLDYCDPAAGSCALVNQTPATMLFSSTINYTTSDFTTQITDPVGRVYKYISNTAARTLSVQTPGSTSTNIAYTLDANNAVTQVVRNGATYGYAQSLAGSLRTVTVTDPLGHTSSTTADTNLYLLKSKTDGVGNTTSYAYDANGNLTSTTSPEGNQEQYLPDARGNITQTTTVPKTGSGLSNIVTSAVYPMTCSNVLTCNKPTSTTDAKDNVTSYTYDSTHGGVLTVTGPAVGGVSPQTRYTYSALQAYYKNSAGTIVASGADTYRLVGVSACATTASCAGTADERKTVIAYGTSGVANNLLPTSSSSGSGDGALTATNSVTYDAAGNLYTSTDPLGQVTRYRFNADREIVGAVSPDPDGTGPLKNRAQRLTRNADGVVTLAEQGTVLSQSDADWSGFTTAQQVATMYDPDDRKTQVSVQAGGTTYAISQFSYDAAGRPDCSTVRMNPSTFGSLPAACTLATAGSYGPDRIVKTTFDAANRPTKTQSAYGTADQSDDTTGIYNANSTLGSLTDANGNVTTYEYDGFDRLSKTRYPSPTTAGTSSTTDYEQLVYDANSNVASRRLRGYASDSSQHIDYTYDALNRVTLKDLPGSEPDVTYSYDLLSRPLSAATSAQTLSFTYDALGRNLTQTGPLGTMTSAYDLAGRRTKLTWPDAFYVNYDYLTTGETNAIRENGATSGAGVLATFAYDDLGRRTGLARGNGTTTSYGFDSVSRLTSLAQDMAGTTYDVSYGFNYNPASQITSTTRSNDAFAYTALANRNDASTVNGLNQATSVGSGSFAYDARGNLTNIGSDGYSYSSENMPISGPAGATFGFDPLMRLYQTATPASGVNRKFGYDGQALVLEQNGSGDFRGRYVYGPGTDEPLVEYDSSSNRIWLHADERGSIVARSDASGAVSAVNTYDEYGASPSVTGRFGYTGQAWLPLFKLYNYKARMYAPSLGRFMQTDPIGYGNGINWYGYVGGDPVNLRDPNGLNACDDQGRYTLRSGYSYATGVSETGQIDYTDVGPVCGGNVIEFSTSPSFGGGGVGGGGNGGGSGAAPAPAAPNEVPQNDDCGGPRLTLGGGVSGTVFALILGGSAGAGANVSVPYSSLSNLSLKGLNVTFSLSLTPLVGLGVFLGAGPSYSGGVVTNSNPTVGNQYLNGSVTGVLQAGAGDGAGVEVQNSFSNPFSISGAGGRIAGGAYGAVGAQFAGNLSTGNIGCRVR